MADEQLAEAWVRGMSAQFDMHSPGGLSVSNSLRSSNLGVEQGLRPPPIAVPGPASPPIASTIVDVPADSATTDRLNLMNSFLRAMNFRYEARSPAALRIQRILNGAASGPAWDKSI